MSNIGTTLLMSRTSVSDDLEKRHLVDRGEVVHADDTLGRF